MLAASRRDVLGPSMIDIHLLGTFGRKPILVQTKNIFLSAPLTINAPCRYLSTYCLLSFPLATTSLQNLKVEQQQPKQQLAPASHISYPQTRF